MQGRLWVQRIALFQYVLYRHPVRTPFRKVQLIDARFSSQNFFCRLYVSKSDLPQSNVIQLHNILNLVTDQTVELPLTKYAEICSLVDVQVLSKVLHFLANNGQHSQLDILYQTMKEHGYHMGQGVNTTLIRSYTARKMWREAIGVLNDMEENQLMKHTRSYNPVITSLAEQGHALEAFHLLQKKIKMYHLIANKRESVMRDTKMFVAMIHCCVNDKPLQKPLLRTLTNEHDSEVKEVRSLVLRLFDFFHEIGIKIPFDILEACQRWFTRDPKHSWIWRNCDINKDGKCNLCGVQLENTLPNGYFNSLEKEIIHKLSDLSDDLKCGQHEIDELKDVHNICVTKGPFDVIIDGQNLGLEGKEKNENSTKLFGKRLVQVVCHISKQGKKIFLPLHHKALENDISEKMLQVLRKHCEIWFIKSNIDDDLLLLYAAASNGMNNSKTSIVSNDNWRDHSLILSNDNRLKLLKWARLNRIMFDLSGKSHFRFFKNSFDPVVQRSEYAWHFPVINGSWRCATLS
ncbi:mitochondrial ribonuclease P catalytic subunit-like [Actinia tenebrosa]|uniref:ribonuclease P n=1 Tax=Actinia tenebrosa TaxID=6105 RepID=A0A6P8IEY9_ACTTE|nr:mitochondrial ribonuclease P catalytic subunit-like [Actinia tenebrosa]